MCTVTYIPVGDTVFLTSNRDEQIQRSQAEPPEIYALPEGNAVFPKDADAGGTWIAGHQNGNAVVILNGALTAHTPQPPYRKSRGLILIDLIDHITPYHGFTAMNLNNIEPFTVIIRDNGHLFECRWDGSIKSREEIDAAIPHIWSSSTLYSDEVIRERAGWFKEWMTAKPSPSMEDILHFHQSGGSGDTENSLLMNREGQAATVSITSMSISEQALTVTYYDAINKRYFTKELTQAKSMAGR